MLASGVPPPQGRQSGRDGLGVGAHRGSGDGVPAMASYRQMQVAYFPRNALLAGRLTAHSSTAWRALINRQDDGHWRRVRRRRRDTYIGVERDVAVPCSMKAHGRVCMGMKWTSNKREK